MKFSTPAVLAALAASVSAKPTLTNSEYSVTEGKPFTLTWDGAVGPVKIVVANGESSDLKPVLTIDSADSGKSFTWTPSGLPSGTYAFEISDSSGTNYSPQFAYKGSGTLSTSASTGTSATSTSTDSTTTTSSSTATATTTKTSSSSSSTKTSSTSSSATTAASTSKPSNTNDSPKYKSPLAFVLVTVASLIYFN